MPFDPSLPANGAVVRAAELRDQFTGLKDLIDNLDASQLDFSGVPTSDPQQAGRLWNDNGTLKISAGPAPLAITSISPIPQHFAGQDYAYDFTAVGGSPPYTWTVVAGGFSGDYTLAANGHLSGNSTDGTDYTFTIQVTDAANATATLDVTWPFGG
jgi:hypothetical protein